MRQTTFQNDLNFEFDKISRKTAKIRLLQVKHAEQVHQIQFLKLLITHLCLIFDEQSIPAVIFPELYDFNVEKYDCVKQK